MRPTSNDEVEALRIDIPDELELAHREAAQTPLARHQRNDRYGFTVCFDEEDIEFLTGAEALPPCANPFVADKRMVGVGFVDQLVPKRFQIEKRLVVCNGFDAPYGPSAPVRYG